MRMFPGTSTSCPSLIRAAVPLRVRGLSLGFTVWTALVKYRTAKNAKKTGKRRNRIDMSEQKITLDEVRHVAKLSRLALDESRLEKFSAQLGSILQYIAKISEADVTGVEPMAHALPIHNVFREDIVEPSLPLEKVLQNAQDSDGPFFKVPKIIGGDEDSAG